MRNGRAYHLFVQWDGSRLLWDGQVLMSGLGNIDAISDGGLDNDKGGYVAPDIPGTDVVDEGGVPIPDVPGKDL